MGTESLTLQQKVKSTSHGEISRATEIHLSHVNRVFNGKRGYSVRNIESFAKFFGVTVDEMIAYLKPIRVKHLASQRKTSRKSTAA